ncbi:hypothetical protein [Zoogloea sp.]|uniref:hypothetical protein n=1 Tax=Zoogloea sp. TaxID=49181 RepID=UPI001AC6E155|nr:hypothetical protein [Zoogloea sp.]MBN8281932.1 hypothetical protein [Zoogloea sp.]
MSSKKSIAEQRLLDAFSVARERVIKRYSKSDFTTRQELPMLPPGMPVASPLFTFVSIPENFVSAVNEAHAVYCLESGENMPLHEFLGLVVIAGLEDF